MRRLNKLLVSMLILGCGLVAGWFVPTRMWKSDLENSLSSLGFFPGWSQPAWNGDLGSFALSLEVHSHCSSDNIHDEHEWLERSVVPTLIDTGKVERKAPRNYQLREKLLLNTFSRFGTTVTAFGWDETREYDEIYYVTPLSYAAIAKRFRQPPNKSGETELLIRKVVAPRGLAVQQVLRLTKTSQGTRVACREMKGGLS